MLENFKETPAQYRYSQELARNVLNHCRAAAIIRVALNIRFDSPFH